MPLCRVLDDAVEGQGPILHETLHRQTLRAVCTLPLSIRHQSVRQVLVHVRAAAIRALIFAGAASDLVGVLLEVRTLFPRRLGVSALDGIGAGSAALPAPVRHVFVFTHAVLRVLRRGGIVGDAHASAGIVDQLVTLLRLLLVPLVVHAYEGARIVDGLRRVCRSIAENKERKGHGDEELFEIHVVHRRNAPP